MRVAHAAGGVAGGMIGGVAARVVVSKVGRAVKRGRLQGEQAGVAVHLPVRPLVVAVTTYRVLFLTMSALRCKVEAEFSPAHLTTMRLERGVQGRSALMFTFVDGNMTGRSLAYAEAGQRVNDVFLRLRRGESPQRRFIRSAERLRAPFGRVAHGYRSNEPLPCLRSSCRWRGRRIPPGRIVFR